jgi:hypothetical protein
MEFPGVGDLVKVATGRAEIDGIVFDVPSASKVVVAVMDRTRGPVFRTVERKAVSERADAGPDDRALELLVRRTAPSSRGSGRGGVPAGKARTAHARGAAHRPTGR